MSRKITIELNCDNAAFDGETGAVEVRRILRSLADRLYYDGDDTEGTIEETAIFDINGNRVGVARFES